MLRRQPLTIPTVEIIDDLLIDNWELRWQVLNIFYQTRKRHPSPAAISKLSSQVVNVLQGENDVNLNLITLALYLLEGRPGIFRLLRKLYLIDNQPETTELATLKKLVASGDQQHTFFHFFLYLLRQEQFPDSAVTLCRRWFNPEELLQLYSAIADPARQLTAFSDLSRQHPEADFNDILLADDLQRLRDNHHLVIFLRPPLPAATAGEIEKMILQMLEERRHLPAALAACRRLKIKAAAALLEELLADKDAFPAACAALGSIGATAGLEKLLRESRALFGGKKAEAAALLGFYHQPEALKALEKLAGSRKQKIREAACVSLARLGSEEALAVLVRETLAAGGKEKKQLLAVIAGGSWDSCPVALADKLVPLAAEPALAPEIFQALEAMGKLERLVPLATALKPPLKNEHQKTMCLYLARQADRPEVRKILLPHLHHPDWSFSYCLLNLLQRHFTIEDFPTLFALLRQREEYKSLTIKERLELGKGDEEFIPAMCTFFNRRPEVPEQLLFRMTNALLTSRMPVRTQELEKIFAGHEAALPRLLYAFYHGSEGSQDVKTEAYFLLLCCYYLDQINIDGASSFAIIVNATRKYSGFFSLSIWAIIHAILQTERQTTSTSRLPYLDQLLQVLRGREGVTELRDLALTIKKRIFSLSRDLYVFTETNQCRDIQVFKVKKHHGH